MMRGAAAGFALLLLSFASAARAESIVFQSTETPPIWSASLPDNGFGGNLLRLVSEAAGVEYSLEYLPVKRFRKSAAPYIVGDPDILEDSGRRAIFPIGVFRSAFFFYTPHHAAVRIQRLEEMSGHVLGVLRGTLEDRAAFDAAGIRIEESDTPESLMRKLERGRVDFAILVYASGMHVVRQLFPQNTQDFAVQYISGTERPIAIMIDTGDARGRAVAQRYRRVLQKTLHSERYHELLKRLYGEFAIPMPATVHEELNRFIDFYSDTWED